MNEQLQLIEDNETEPTIEEKLAELGRVIYDKLEGTVEPVARLDETDRPVDMTYRGPVVHTKEGTMRYVWREVSVTIPDDNKKPRSYAVVDELPRTPLKWQDGDTSARYAEKDIRGPGYTDHELTADEIERLIVEIAESRVFDPMKEENVIRLDDVKANDEIVSREQPGRLRRLLGRRATRKAKAIR